MTDRIRRGFSLVAAAAATLVVALSAQSPSTGGPRSIAPASLKEWLTYIASDELQGREVYTEGLGLAASYIASHLKEWGVKPASSGGDYFQTIKVVGVRANSTSSVTVAVRGQSRTFKDGEGISLPRNMGGRQTVTSADVEFVGNGLALSADRSGNAAGDPEGKVIVWLGTPAPSGGAAETGRERTVRTRGVLAPGAVAIIGPPAGAGRGGRGRGQTGAGRGSQPADFTTVERLDRPLPPAITAQEEFFEFLFSGAEVEYAELKALAAKQQPLPRFALKDVTLRIDVEPDYAVVSTRLSRNIVGIIEGTDPKLKDTFVAFGAHYDHIGYQETPPSGRGGVDPGGCVGQTRPQPRPDDVVYNGADDDGSGTVALMAIARAFALGPRPKRSLVFVWHTGEESGLQGSRYNADHPVVPNDRIIAQLNVDMIGRNRCDREGDRDTVYLIGSDRISTDLHNISEDANAALARPMTLDYELNDPADPQALYTRSDHYSYAAKGIPIIFYTTGLHRDYHFLTDEVDKIEWDKLARVTQLIYATGQRLANLERTPVRDNKGPRVGKGTGGRLK